ncbi:MAG TPA: YbhB/YbcL family Raf kinase inhibitor-like protein [Kofleriaceae bacterium]|nr:YbhB/YbcL family Raf kinase inhibitor-like protein [Kofleriaceae bacterium]
MALTVRSPAFGGNGMIPIEFTAEGDNVAPPLSWSAVPSQTRSVAVIVEDPDAPGRTYVHWIVIGIPPSVTSLPGGHELPAGAVHGANDRGELGWTGPNPPSGRHRYFFKVFALDNAPSTEGMSKQDFYSAIKGHILAQGELVGTYERKRGNARANMPGSTGAHTRR